MKHSTPEPFFPELCRDLWKLIQVGDVLQVAEKIEQSRDPHQPGLFEVPYVAPDGNHYGGDK